MRPHAFPALRDDVPPPPPGAGAGRLMLAVGALAALAILEPRLLDGFSLDGLAALRPIVRSLAIAAGLWGYL